MHPAALHFSGTLFEVFMMMLIVGATMLVIAAIVAVWWAFTRVRSILTSRGYDIDSGGRRRS